MSGEPDDYTAETAAILFAAATLFWFFEEPKLAALVAVPGIVYTAVALWRAESRKP